MKNEIEIPTDSKLLTQNDNYLVNYLPQPQTISFHIKNQEIMKITEEGFFWKGKLVENDKEIYQQFKKFLSGELYNE